MSPLQRQKLNKFTEELNELCDKHKLKLVRDDDGFVFIDTKTDSNPTYMVMIDGTDDTAYLDNYEAGATAPSPEDRPGTEADSDGHSGS